MSEKRSKDLLRRFEFVSFDKSHFLKSLPQAKRIEEYEQIILIKSSFTIDLNISERVNKIGFNTNIAVFFEGQSHYSIE